MKKLLFIAAVLLFAWLGIHPMPAQIKLSGITAYDSTANGVFWGFHRWNTRGGDTPWNVYLFTNSILSPVFLNSGDTDASLNPNFVLLPGTNIIYFAGASDRGNYLGVNLYFNDDLITNRITVVVQNNGSTNFSVVPPSMTTFGQNGNQPGAGADSFTNADWTVTVSGYHTILPRPDVVSAFNPGPDGGVDTVGVLTLVVQSPAPLQHAFGGENDDVLASVQQTHNGGCFLGGFSRSGANGNKTASNFGDYDFWLLHLDYHGSNLWQKTLGGSDDDRCQSVRQTPDRGFIVGGYSYSPISGSKTAAHRGSADFWVQRLDEKGNKIWEETYGGDDFDTLQKCEVLLDGFALGGYSFSGVTGNKTAAGFGLNDFWLVRVDAGGNILWDKAFGGEADDVLRDLKSTGDGGFILAGSSASGVSGNKDSDNFGLNDGWLLRLDDDGNKLWEKSFGGTSLDEIWSVQLTRDGGSILGGRSSSAVSGNKTSTNFGNLDGWVIRLDASGNKLWEKSFGGTNYDVIVGVQPTRDDGFMLAGYSYSDISGNKTNTNFGENDWWLIGVDANGNIISQQSFGGSDFEELFTFEQSRSGGFLLGGYSTSGISGNKTNANFGLTDMWLVRLPSTYPAELNIARKNPGVDVFWDLDFAGWTLQAASSFTPANWQNVLPTPQQTNGYHLVPFPNLADKVFFRLKKE